MGAISQQPEQNVLSATFATFVTDSLLLPHLKEIWYNNNDLLDFSTSRKASCRHIWRQGWTTLV
jgi:hypothetical protein